MRKRFVSENVCVRLCEEERGMDRVPRVGKGVWKLRGREKDSFKNLKHTQGCFGSRINGM